MYLLDANAFMEASRLYYGFDIAPGFWTWLGDRKLTGQVASIEAVKDEITAGTPAPSSLGPRPCRQRSG